jgi:hypothetical protein
MLSLGTIRPGRTIYIPFETFASSSGAPITISGFAVGDIKVYKDGGTTERASTSGYALLDTDGIDFDGITGIHGCSIDLSDNTTADFWQAGSTYFVVISVITVDSQTMSFLAGHFKIGYDAAVLNTFIATLASQTSFTLNMGPAEDDALNGSVVVIHDAASAVQQAFAIVADYTGATKTVTLVAAPTFTIAAKDNICFFPPALQPTAWGRTLDVSAGGEAGLDWANIGSPTTAQTLSGTSTKALEPTTAGRTLDVAATGEAGLDFDNIKDATGAHTLTNIRVPNVTLTDTVTTYTGNTLQTGDSFARLGAPAGASVSADIADVEGKVDDLETRLGTPTDLGSGATIAANLVDIEAQTDDIGAAGAGLTAVPWNAAWDAEVQSEVDDALVVHRLDELLNADSDIDGAAPPTVGSVFHELLTKTAGSFTYDQATDSLEAIRDRGDAAWTTGASQASVDAIQADTDDIQTRLPAALVGGRMDASVGAMAADVITAAAIATDAIGSAELAASAITEIQAGLSTLTAAQAADAVWDETLADHLAAGSTGNALNAAGAAGDPWTTAIPGAYGAGTAGNIVGNRLDVAVSSRLATAGYTAPPSVGAIADQVWDEALADHQGVGSTGEALDAASAGGGLDAAGVRAAVGLASANLDTQLSGIQSDTNDVQTRLPAALVSGRMDSHIGSVADAVLTAAKFAAGAFDAVWSVAARLLTAGTNIVLAKGTGVTGFNDLSAAQVNAEVDTALADYDGPTSAELVSEIDAVQAQITALNNLSAAQVNAEMVDVLSVDTQAELAAVPAANATLAHKLGWLFLLARNKITQTATTQLVRNDGDTATVGTSTVSDDSTTFVRDKFS